MDYFEWLPDELILKIIQYDDNLSRLLILLKVCKRIYNITNSKEIINKYKRLCVNDQSPEKISDLNKNYLTIDCNQEIAFDKIKIEIKINGQIYGIINNIRFKISDPSAIDQLKEINSFNSRKAGNIEFIRQYPLFCYEIYYYNNNCKEDSFNGETNGSNIIFRSTNNRLYMIKIINCVIIVEYLGLIGQISRVNNIILFENETNDKYLIIDFKLTKVENFDLSLDKITVIDTDKYTLTHSLEYSLNIISKLNITLSGIYRKLYKLAERSI